MSPDALAHGEEIRAGFDQDPGVVDGDTSDGDAGNLHHLLPDREDFRIGPIGRFLGQGREESTKGDIVSPRFGSFHGEVTTVVAGGTDHGGLAHDPPRRGDRGVGLAYMNAIAAERGCKVGPVIQDHRCSPRLRYRCQPPHGGSHNLVWCGLQPDLKRRDRAGLQRLFKRLGESLQVRKNRRCD